MDLSLIVFIEGKEYIPSLSSQLPPSFNFFFEQPCSFNLRVHHSTVSFHSVDQGSNWLLKLSEYLVGFLHVIELV